MTLFPRSCGVLMHPTSLPGRYGIGDLGANAYRFVDWLQETGQSIWQVLPLGPTSYGDSPYQTLSAFAGNPNLVSLDLLVEAGYLTADDLADVPDFPEETVDYGWIIPYHDTKLSVAYSRFLDSAPAADKAAYEEWCQQEAHWLDDFALFAALKRFFGGAPWVKWPEKGLVRYENSSLAKARETRAKDIDEQRFRQWLFFKQWLALKEYANQKGIRLFGDLPIFVAHDSSDVWANQSLYYLHEDGNPTVIAGVPPDYFSPTGQRWGNPLYRWGMMKNSGYAWWIERFKAILSQVDYIRVDHFRGFEAYWEIPATEETAINGRWVPGPGHDFFKAVEEALGELPIIAEDLGVITEGVEALRDDFGLPGMKVLQFAWSDPKNVFLPHNHVTNCVVYSGTHDNNTTVGWWENEMDDGSRQFMQDYLAREVQEPQWILIRLALGSPAHTAIYPMQDVLALGAEARMNTPGKQGGNWGWRMTEADFDHANKDLLAQLTWLYMRRPDQQEKVYGDAAIKD